MKEIGIPQGAADLNGRVAAAGGGSPRRPAKERRAAAFRRLGVMAALVGACLAFSLISAAASLRAQALQGTVVINLNFVNAQGQPTAPPDGTAGGVQFLFSPTTSGISQQTLVTNAQSQTGAGQAIGSLATGTYTVQEIPPSGANFANATVTQTNGQSLSLTNPGTITIAPGATYTIAVTNQVTGQSTGTAALTIFKNLTTPSGQATTGTLSGFSFTLAGQAGSDFPTQTQTTNQLGQASFSNLPAGVYSLTEATTTGATFSSMTINGVAAQQGQQFQIQAGGSYNVNVTNTITSSTSGNVSIQTQLVDQNGQTVSSGTLSGYTFAISPQSGTTGSPTTVVSGATGLATADLAPGSYVISETPPAGSTLVSFTINNVPTTTGVFTVGTGQTTSIVATNRVSSTSTGAAGGTRTVTLQTGCNNIVDTYPDGTTGAAIAAGLVPSTSIDSIWHFDNQAQVFKAAFFAPATGGIAAPVDIQTLNRLDALFVCVTTPATLSEPGA